MATSTDDDLILPGELALLQRLNFAADQTSIWTDKFLQESGKKTPATTRGFGSLLSLLYQAACCAWGCSGGDHQIEWLTGRVVNLAQGSYRLLRSALYDESLSITRSIGELANLAHLFVANPVSRTTWVTASRSKRLKQFGPGAVRNQIRAMGSPVLIDDDRYRALCEVGTHPVPSFAPNHFTGTGRPILGVIPQPVGVYVCITELAYATCAAALPLAKLLDIPPEREREIVVAAGNLAENLGTFNVLNYEELLSKVHSKQETTVEVEPRASADEAETPA